MAVKLEGTPTASEDEAAALAEEMTLKMQQLYPGAQRGWVMLFNRIDADGSGKISYAEFSNMVKELMAFGQQQQRVVGRDLRDEAAMEAARKEAAEARKEAAETMAAIEARVQSVWKTIDTDNSGLICLGEFGRFMRKGSSMVAKQAAEKRTEREEAVNLRRRAAEEEQKARALQIKHVQDMEHHAAARKVGSITQQLEKESARLEEALRRKSFRGVGLRPIMRASLNIGAGERRISSGEAGDGWTQRAGSGAAIALSGGEPPWARAGRLPSLPRVKVATGNDF